MGLFRRAVSKLEELQKSARERASRNFLAQAEDYRSKGNLKRAIAILERGVRDNPNHVAAQVSLARAYQQQGSDDQAIYAYSQALKLDRENLVAVRQLADIYVRKGDKVEAIKKLKLYRALNPGDREV